MPYLKWVLVFKICFTLCAWCLPLLCCPRWAAQKLGMPQPQPLLFAHLLGAAFLALVAGYTLGLKSLTRGEDISNVVLVGVISNGLACLILLISGLNGSWNQWGRRAQIFMWVSTVVTGIITLGLVVTHILKI